MKRARVILLILAFIFPAAAVRAQVPVGDQPFGSFSGSSFDTVNNSDLNVNMTIPVVHKAGRGISFYYDLGYNSSIWTPVRVNGVKTWTPPPGMGWQGLTSAYAGYLTYDWEQGSCFANGEWEYYDEYTNWGYYDPSGSAHSFNLTTSDAEEMAFECYDQGAPPDSGAATTTDGSGYTIGIVSAWTAMVQSPNGTLFEAPYNSPAGLATVYDSHLNHVDVTQSQNTTFTDTEGTTALTISGSNPVIYTYTAADNTAAHVTMKKTSYTVRTHFACSGVAENGPTTRGLVTEIDLPDGEKYTFTYEDTPGFPGDKTGRLASVTLPTGGTISYTYSGGSNGITCADGSAATLTRVLDGSSTWQYQHSENDPVWTTTVNDPQNNQTTIYFQQAYIGPGESSPLETQRQLPGGETVDTCYNGAQAPCTSTSLFLPINQVTQTVTLSNGQKSETNTNYTTYGYPSEVDQYDYGSGGVGALLRKTTTAYDTLNGYSCACGSTQYLPFYKPATVSVYDGNLNLVAQTTYSYNQTAETPTSGTPQHGAIFYYGSPGDQTSVTRGGLTWQYTYYDTGEVQTAKDPNGNETTYNSGTGACGNTFPTTITRPMNLTTSETWNCNGAVLSTVTGPNGTVTAYDYDNMNRLTRTSYMDGGYVTTSYPSANEIDTTTAISSGVERTDTTILDSLGRVSSQTFGGLTTTNTSYNSLGQVAEVSNSESGAQEIYAYDVLGRVVSVTHADGNAVNTDYTNPTCPKVTDDAERIRQVCSDALGRVISVTEDPGGLAYQTTYTYDAMGDLTGVIQGAQTRTFAYDGLGRLTSATTPEAKNQATTYYYTTSGGGLCSGDPNAVCRRTNAVPVTTTYTYDALNRLTAKTYSDSTPPAYYYYDEASFTLGGTPYTIANGKGRLTHATTVQSGAIQTAVIYSYDDMGRVQDYWQCTPANCGNSSIWDLHYNYDLADDVTSWTHPAGFTVTNQIDQNQRITQISSSWNDSTHPATLATMAYNAWGGLATLTNGCVGSGCIYTQETFDYNDRLQPVRIQLGTNSNPSADSCMVYNYYQGGQQPTGCTNAPAQASSGNDGTVAGYLDLDNVNTSYTHVAGFTYDALGRLASGTYTDQSTPPNVLFARNFTYDQWGNLTCGPGGSSTCNIFNPDSSTNRILSIGPPGNQTIPTYDAAGDVTSISTGAGSFSYTWDAEGRLATTTNPSDSFVYNALGEQVADNGGANLYDPSGALVAQWNTSSGSWDVNGILRLGPAMIAEYKDGTTYMIHRNALGSTSMLTGPAGDVQSDVTFTPFGNTWEGSLAPEDHFAGFDRNLGWGLYPTPNRQYHWDTGRWLTPDPAGRAAASPANPQSWNRYAYVLNNPTSLIDPLGLKCVTLDSGAVGDDGTPPPCQNITGNSPDTDTVTGAPPPAIPLLEEYLVCDPLRATLTPLACSLDINGREWSLYYEGPVPVSRPFTANVAPAGQPPLGGRAENKEEQPQSQAPQQTQKKPCTPLQNNLQGTPAAGVDTLFDAFSRVTHPLDMLAVNATMFLAAGGQIAAGGMAIAGGCLEPTPFEPLTCVAGGAAGTVSIASGTASGAFGVYFFKNYTLPAIKDWGCHE